MSYKELYKDQCAKANRLTFMVGYLARFLAEETDKGPGEWMDEARGAHEGYKEKSEKDSENPLTG